LGTKINNASRDVSMDSLINLHAKFEVSMFIHYKDMKGNVKCSNSGFLGVRG